MLEINLRVDPLAKRAYSATIIFAFLPAMINISVFNLSPIYFIVEASAKRLNIGTEKMTSLVSEIAQGFKTGFINSVKKNTSTIKKDLYSSLYFGATNTVPLSLVTAVLGGLSQSPTYGFATRNILLLGAATSFSIAVYSLVKVSYFDVWNALEAADKEKAALQKRAIPSCAKSEEKKDSPVQVEKVAKEAVKTEIAFAVKV